VICPMVKNGRKCKIKRRFFKEVISCLKVNKYAM
jgi:hypothetical protein